MDDPFNTQLVSRGRDLLRAAPLALLCAISLAVVAWLAPQKVGLAVWGLSKIALGGYVGYWADRWAFGDAARPHRLAGMAQATAWLRRALIISASIIATALLP